MKTLGRAIAALSAVAFIALCTAMGGHDPGPTASRAPVDDFRPTITALPPMELADVLSPPATGLEAVFRDIDPPDSAVTRRAYDVFVKYCPGLKKLGALVESITVRDEAIVMNDEAMRRKWPIAVSVEVKFRENATSVAWDLGVVLMNDYVFLLGSGKAPGILSLASDGLRLCVPHYPSNFMPVAGIRLPAEWPSDAADRRSHPRRKLDSTVYPLGEGPPIPVGR